MTTPPAAPAPSLSLDPSAILYPDQLARMVAIEAATKLLNDAGVPYSLFASPDAPSEEMKVLSGHRLTYSTDLATLTKETQLSRQAMTWAALAVFSRGMQGSLILIDVEGNPICAFGDGEAKRLVATASAAPRAGRVVA